MTNCAQPDGRVPFYPPDTLDEIEAQSRVIQDNRPLLGVLNVVPSLALVLNRSRQIVFANESLLRFIGGKSLTDLLGKRIGDIMDCKNAVASKQGCGFSESCAICGTAKAISAFLQRGATEAKENRITQHCSGQALDFRVHAVPFPDEAHQDLLLLFLTDIADEKRRRALERIFFHDVANISYGMVGLTEALRGKKMNVEKRGRFLDVLNRYSKRLAAEIDAQRLLNAAENHELRLKLEPCATLTVINEVAGFYDSNGRQDNCRVLVSAEAASLTLVTDQRLLQRILDNMTKNAVEASPHDGLVSLGCKDLGEDGAEFWVHNDGFIPREIQLQIFQRSFSSKGHNRGLGTHSIKLLGERYLKGRVSFSSSPETGTTFRFACPSHLSPDPG